MPSKYQDNKRIEHLRYKGTMPTIGEALFEVHGLVNEEISRLKKGDDKDKEMALLLHNSISAILFKCN